MADPLTSARRRLFAAFRGQGDKARGARDWRRAATGYSRALKVDAEAWPIWVQLGHARLESGDCTGARTAYLRALTLAPRVSDTALHLGHVSKLLGDIDAAQVWYARALAWPPGEADAARELAALGFEGQTLETLLAATELADFESAYPNQPSALLPDQDQEARWQAARADSARDARDWPRAVAAYRRALAGLSGEWPLWVQLGHALKESGSRREARAAYLRALSLAPGVSDTALQLGHVSKLLGLWDDAAIWYAKALAWPPGEVDAAIELARLGYEGARADALLRDVAPTAGPAAVAPDADTPPLRLRWLPTDTPVAEITAAEAWLAEIGQALTDQAPSPDGYDLLVAAPRPDRFSRAEAIALRTKVVRDRSRLVVVLTSTEAWLAQARENAFAALLEMAGCIVTFTDADARMTRARLGEIGLDRTVRRLDLPQPAKATGALGRNDGYDLLLAGDPAETAALLTAHAKMGPGRTVKVVDQAGLSDSDLRKMLASARTVAVPSGVPDVEVWLSRACAAGLPVLSAAHGPAYALFGAAIADYAALPEAGDLPGRWAALGPARASVEDDAARWASAIVAALVSPAARRWLSPQHDAPLLAFGDFVALSDDGDGARYCLGGGWSEFTPRGAVIAGSADLRFRLPPHRSPIRLMVFFAPSPSAKAQTPPFSLSVRTGDVTVSADHAPLGPAAGWAGVSITPQVGPEAEMILTLSTGAEAATTVAGFAAYPEREDRYWYELFDRAARGQAQVLWTMTRRLGAPHGTAIA